MWNEKPPVCSVDTLLNQKECTTNLKEWVKYNINDFPGLKGTLSDVILNLKVRTKDRPVPVDNKNSEEFINYLSKQNDYEAMTALLYKYEKFIKTGSFYVIDQQVYTDVTEHLLIKYYGITISPMKNWIETETLKINYDILTNKKHR